MAKTIRLPDDLYEKIKAQAKREKRSATNMLAVLLQEALEARKR